MVNAVAYKEHLNPVWSRSDEFEREKSQRSESYLTYTNSLSNLHDNDEPADIVFFTDGRIAKLRGRYEFRDDELVETFLDSHAFLIRPLLDAYDKVREYFSPQSRLALKVAIDPEAPQDQQLFVFIQTTLGPRAARTLLAEFDRNWWLSAFPSTRGKLTIGLEYV